MATQRFNTATGLWESYDIPPDVNTRLAALEQNQAQNWNFAPNPSLEQWSTDSTTAGTPSNWSTLWNAGAAGSHTYGKSTTCRTGAFAFATAFSTTSVSGDFRRLQSDGMPCMPGQWWEASVWVRASVASRGTVTLTAQFGIDANTNYFDANTTNIDAVTAVVANTTGWVQLVGRVQVPVGKSVMRLVVSMTQNVAAGLANTITVDDISLRLVDMNPASQDLTIPRGLMAYVSNTNSVQAFTTSAVTDITGGALPSAFTAEAGRLYRVTVTVPWWASAVNLRFAIHVREGTTSLLTYGHAAVNGGVAYVFNDTMITYMTFAAGAHTLKLAGALTNGTGTITLNALATMPLQLVIEDAGLA